MNRMDLDAVFQPLPAIAWPGGGEVTVKPLNFRQQRTAALLEKGEADPFAILPQLVAEVTGKPVAEIEEALNGEQMMLVLYYAGGHARKVQEYLEAMASGNALAGATDQASLPQTPSGTSSPALPAPTAVPCGAS
jgi:hypothetical protein